MEFVGSTEWYIMGFVLAFVNIAFPVLEYKKGSAKITDVIQLAVGILILIYVITKVLA